MKICVKFEYNDETYVTLPNVPQVKAVRFCNAPSVQASIMDGTVCNEFINIPFLRDVEVEDIGSKQMYVKGICTWNDEDYLIDTKINGLEATPVNETTNNEDEPEAEEVQEAHTEEADVQETKEAEQDVQSEPEPEPEVVSEPVKKEDPELVPNTHPSIKFVFGRKGQSGVVLQGNLSHYTKKTKKKVVAPKPEPIKIEEPAIKEEVKETTEEEFYDEEDKEPLTEDAKFESFPEPEEVELEEEQAKEEPQFIKSSERFVNASSSDLVKPTTLEDVRRMEEEEAEVEIEEEVAEERKGFPSWVYELPRKLLKNVKAYTNKEIDVEALKTEGWNYCKRNKWQVVDDLACIDELPTKLRYVYNQTYEEYVTLSREDVRNILK